MGVGKIAAQVAQAALGLQASLLRNSSKTRGRVSLERDLWVSVITVVELLGVSSEI